MVLFALGSGVATFFAPCSYALLPGYVGYYVAATGQERAPLGGAAVRGGAAAIGALAVFVVLSVLAVVAGEVLERTLPVLEVGVGVALVVLGAWILYAGSGAVHVMLPERRATVSGFTVFGGMYALAATACVLPLFLAVAFQSLTLSTTETALVLGSYAGGFAVLMLSVTVAIAVGHNLGAGRIAPRSDWLIKLAGGVIVLAGFGQLYVAL
ncbi:cytochrome c biogenesis protein CcdA [Natronobacterium texcoconense]|uniref:Cytochrome c-type biogenesis protein n=1 Tax=Natronobacterium texcoconense TaxID=1095778 RepID=A0A1H1AW76_NATTX|nr:cytochrome c biogenesis protein CcdA [Natronobacterium texcoconense]SDQ43771.1 cytochrome c-type biogenesis protein [Natronobacterium texcoconense]